MIFLQSICGWPSKPHLFNFMHQWDDTSCFVQCDSLLHCITQRADATRHAKLTWSSNPGNLRQQDPPLQLALFDKPHYSPSSLLFFFCTNDENGVFWKRCLGNGCGMWITPGWIGVELMQFLCFGLLRRVGSLWFLGSLGKGSGWLWCFQGCAKLAFYSGTRLQFSQLLVLHLSVFGTPPVLQRGCGFNKPCRNFSLSTIPLLSSCHLAFVGKFFSGETQRGTLLQLFSSSDILWGIQVISSVPIQAGKEEYCLADMRLLCGTLCSHPGSCQHQILAFCAWVKHNHELQGEEKADVGHEYLQSQAVTCHV